MRGLWFLCCALHLQLAPLLVRAADELPPVRLDPNLDALLAPEARVEMLFRADTVFDGLAWVRNGEEGYLLFSDVPGNAIDRLTPDGRVSVLQKDIFSGMDTSKAYTSPGSDGRKAFRLLGAAGVTLDQRGRIVYCAHSDGQIVRLETDGQRTILASRLGANRLNGPNDLTYRSDGTLYFTDSRVGAKRADGAGIPHKGLYLLQAGEVRLLSKEIEHPNGVALSPGEKYLYVSNTLRMNILRFEITRSGIANETVFVDMSDAKAVGSPDGIKVDRLGNVYSTGPGGVWIMSPAGKHLGTILTPTRINNIAFGGKDGRTLYLSSSGALYRIPLKVAGA
jgi:gluconolactonase